MCASRLDSPTLTCCQFPKAMTVREAGEKGRVGCVCPGDSWLDISAQELEHLLEERGGRGLGGVGGGSSRPPSSRRAPEVSSEEVKEGEDASYSLVDRKSTRLNSSH